MDSINHFPNNPSLSVKGIKEMKISKCESFFSTYNDNQDWALPSSIIYFIAKNPNCSKVYEKLIKCCKYFFATNPILVSSDLFVDYQNKWYLSINGTYIDIYKIRSKLWINNYLILQKLNKVNDNFFGSLIVPKIFECTVKEIALVNHDILFKDLNVIVKMCEKINFNNSYVFHDENSIELGLEEIFSCLTKVKRFCGDFSFFISKIITAKTVEKLIKIPHFEHVFKFKLRGIPECFDIVTFISYVKKVKTLSVRLDFDQDITKEYHETLQTIVNNIIKDPIGQYCPPRIRFFRI